MFHTRRSLKISSIGNRNRVVKKRLTKIYCTKEKRLLNFIDRNAIATSKEFSESNDAICVLNNLVEKERIDKTSSVGSFWSDNAESKKITSVKVIEDSGELSSKPENSLKP